MKTATQPEERLLSAVVTLAIHDACLPPLKITVVVKEKKKKVPVLCYNAQSAYTFLFNGGADGYYAALDMDPTETKRRLMEQLCNYTHNKPFDITDKKNELIDRKKRLFKLNHRLYHDGHLRGNFKELPTLDNMEVEDDMETEDEYENLPT
jgi:hypothetical protein